MPTSEQILELLAWTAREGLAVAVAWHLIVAIVAIALALGKLRPTRRAAAIALGLPLATVAALAVRAGNPFNAAMFSLATTLAIALGSGAGKARVTRGPAWAVAIGVASIAYAFVYPHFLEGYPAYYYLFASPMGVVPCPTLALVLGTALVAGGFQARAWPLSMAAFGLFYAVYGVARLGVWLDAGLAITAVALIVCALRRPERAATEDHRHTLAVRS